MATAPASSTMTAPRADQPRVMTEQLKRGESAPSLTLRQTGIKNYSGRSQRDYGRR